MSEVMTFTDDNFASEVLTADQPVLVDFWAPWCGPCRLVAPLVDALAQEQPEFKFGKMNIDESPKVSEEYGVMSLPTIIVFKGGEVFDKFSGVPSKKRLEEALAAAK